MSVRTKKKSFLGLIAGRLLWLFGKSLPEPKADDLNRMEFKTSTQRLGVRFSERIRSVFRFRWIKKS